MRGGHRRLATAALVGLAASVSLGCSGKEPGDATPSSTESSAPPFTAGPVAATELVTGDCLTGFAIGGSERLRIDSAEVVSCAAPHQLEVFSVFSLAGQSFPNTEEGVYPGLQRIVDAADQGCVERLEEIGGEASGYGLVVVWPTDRSWATGDRDVVCAAYSADGQRFDGPTIIAG